MWSYLAFIVLLNSFQFSRPCDVTIESDNGRTHCYYVTEQTLSRDDADTYCYDVYGGSVLTVTSPEEQDAILDLMRVLNMPSVWLGLKEVFSTWQWLDGGEISEQGCFNDNPSSREFRERNIIENNTYEACIAECQEKGYSYAAPQVLAEITNAGVQWKKATTFCWCGDSFGAYGHSTDCSLSCPGNRDQQCGGDTQNQVLSVRGTYSNWLPGQPNNHLDYQSCTVMDPREEGGKWLDTKCSDRMGTLCVIDNRTQCSNLAAQNLSANEYISEVISDSHCYYVSTDHVTWSVGYNHCRSRGGNFVGIHDAVIQDEIMRFFNAQPEIATNIGNAEGIWIGLQRSRWWWSTGEEVRFTDWGSGEPNSADQHCVLMYEFNGWQDQDCAGPFPTICEIDSAINYVTSTTQSTSTTTTATTTTTRTTSTTTEKSQKQKVRKNPRVHSDEKQLEDEHLASIVGGGVVIILIILIVTTIACVVHSRKKKKRREEKEEAKREKYFFGFDGQDIGDTTMERKPNKMNFSKVTNPKKSESVNAETSNQTDTKAKNGVFETVVGIETEDKTVSLEYENPSFEGGDSEINKRKSDIKRLSDKPDVVPD